MPSTGAKSVIVRPVRSPRPEVPERSGGLAGGLQISCRSLEPSFEAASRHLRMRWRVGSIGVSGRSRSASLF
ncbi:hypothetical protein MMR14E_12620 [Methylobacterium mesophilicum]